jgi:ABC-type dipeptide/oligopeptide/nickel transport system permease component
LLIFAIRLQLLPVFGDRPLPSHLILPALALGVSALAGTLAYIRSRTLAASHRDGSWAVVVVYLLGATLAGTFVVEPIFAWPGIGLGDLESANSLDRKEPAQAAGC